MNLPESIYHIEESDLYRAKTKRTLRSMDGLASQQSKHECDRYWAQSIAYWQIRCAIAERLAYYPDRRSAA